MIGSIVNILTNQTLVNMSQNTVVRTSIETGLKSVGRPSFILMDKDLDDNTKKYTATKEFLYQAICLAVYLLVIPPIFKRGVFALAKKLYKNTKGFEKFKNAGEFLSFHKLASLDKEERLIALKNEKNIKKLKNSQNLLEELKTQDKVAENYYLQKGVIEGGSLVGSVLGLALLAPEVSHHIIHPVMKALGMEKSPDKN